MKIIISTAIAAVLGSTAFSRDFRPATHLENIPVADSSILQCCVIQTTAGVRYPWNRPTIS